eukprot:scaffold61692_cov73-Phaeocystis_antarctica.AAC.8
MCKANDSACPSCAGSVAALSEIKRARTSPSSAPSRCRARCRQLTASLRRPRANCERALRSVARCSAWSAPGSKAIDEAREASPSSVIADSPSEKASL